MARIYRFHIPRDNAPIWPGFDSRKYSNCVPVVLVLMILSVTESINVFFASVKRFSLPLSRSAVEQVFRLFVSQHSKEQTYIYYYYAYLSQTLVCM